MKKLIHVKLIWITVAAVIAIGGIIALVLYLMKPQIPPAISRQVNFVFYYPRGGAWSVEQDTLKFDPGTKVLSYIAGRDGKKISVSQQATPDIFNDVPEYYGKFLEGYHLYKAFDSHAGRVNLTKPEEYKGGQTAIMNTKGTLLFARPTPNLTDDEWLDYFSDLEEIR